MFKRILVRFLRGLVAVALPVVAVYLAEQVELVSQDVPAQYAAFAAPLLLALGKWLRESGVKRVPF